MGKTNEGSGGAGKKDTDQKKTKYSGIKERVLMQKCGYIASKRKESHVKLATDQP